MADRVRRFIDWIRAALAPSPQPCVAAYNTRGIDYRTTPSGTKHAHCACGFQFAAKSGPALLAAIADHLVYRVQHAR